MADPMDPIYETIDEAAIAALDEIFPASRHAREEYAVAIYQDHGTFLYGFTHFVTDNRPASVSLVAPFGADIVANAHTHPHKPSDGYLPHHISNHKDATQGMPSYWIAPNGTVHVYEPSIRKRRMVRVHHHKPRIVH